MRPIERPLTRFPPFIRASTVRYMEDRHRGKGPMERRRLLVVEDDAAIGSMVVDLLRPDGFDVTVVADGRKALDALRSTFDVVLLDVMLPGMDGIAILRAIREDPATASLPVVMLTAKTDDESTWAGWRAGCDYFMTKPFDPVELVEVLNRLQREPRTRTVSDPPKR